LVSFSVSFNILNLYNPNSIPGNLCLPMLEKSGNFMWSGKYFDTVGWVLRPVKNRRPYNLYCVGGDVKPCSINQSISLESGHPAVVCVCHSIGQNVIDEAIDQWRARLTACVRAKGGHFEHLI